MRKIRSKNRKTFKRTFNVQRDERNTCTRGPDAERVAHTVRSTVAVTVSDCDATGCSGAALGWRRTRK